jgi:hypothetical protein
MPKWKLTSLIALILSLTVIIPAIVRAQEELKLSAVEVDLWPEYDRPEVLVIYRITLSPSVSPPADMTFRLPVAAGEPSAVAGKQVTADGEEGLFNIPYDYRANGEWGFITLTATMPEIQLEYYDPGLVRDGLERRFVYRWPGDYAVDSLMVQVQQPLDASGMRISPASGEGVTRPDGLVYFNKQVGSLPAGQTFDLKFDYQKDSESLSAASLQVQPSVPMPEVTSPSSNFMSVLPWILGVMGLILIVGGGVWYWQSGKETAGPSPRRRRRSAAQVENAPVGEHVYCHQCGKRAAPGDRFCRICGTRLRKEA